MDLPDFRNVDKVSNRGTGTQFSRLYQGVFWSMSDVKRYQEDDAGNIRIKSVKPHTTV